MPNVQSLRDYYELEKRPLKVHEPYQMVGLLEEDLKQGIEIDVDGVFPHKTMFGFAAEKWKAWTFNGLDVLVPEKFNATRGREWRYAHLPRGRLERGPFLRDPRGIRNYEMYVSTRSRRDYIHQVFSKQCEIALANLARIHERIRDAVDAVFLCGTDFGTQTSSFCPVPAFREPWLPYFTRVCGWIHRHTSWKCFKHSCGSVERFYPSFIEAGFEVVNAVQCSAAGMEPEGLKAKYGDRLVFWGGGVDTQKTLPFGTPVAVREQVLGRCEVFAANGGFVFNSIHNIQAGTPVENIVAMLDAVREFNGRV